MQTVIETKALCKQYGPHTAVDHVELHVPQGCVYGFIGPNGAGKSTTMKMLLGLIHPTAGRVRLLGQELTEKSRLPLLRQTGSLIESPAGYLHLTAQENLEIVADLKGVPHKDIGRVLDIVHLTQDRNRRVGQYSLGMKQRHGNAEPLLHAEGILPHLPVGIGSQVDDLQHPVNVLVGNAFQVGHDGQIFPGRQMQIAGGGFDQASGLPQQGDAVCYVHGMAQQLHAAAGGVHQPQQHLHAGGFARTVRA